MAAKPPAELTETLKDSDHHSSPPISADTALPATPGRPNEALTSKAKLKKEAKKAAKKEAKKDINGEDGKARASKPTASTLSSRSKPATHNSSKANAEDPDSMFKVGFLADVYKERPVGSAGIQSVITRFPPEPNGFLHIGHSKAIAINFGFARYHGGECYLRFDDTNPAGEKKEYDDSIEETVRWLGFTPKKITHSSDNFEHLYNLAEVLIEKGKAYVCHCSKHEIVDQRGGGEGKKPRYGCQHRDRPSSESLTEFRAMRDGKYGPNEAALRMKQNLEDGNPQMWDLVAYRIPQSNGKLETVVDNPQKMNEKSLDNNIENGEDVDERYTGYHYRTGDSWKIYPTYDFTHGLCDSFEGITHSLCTTEFELSRVSYEWLNKELGVYEPMQREYGRLSVSGTVLSKRKITKLVSEGHVGAWDDPRLYTLPALRRRGVPPGAILSFVNELGVTKATTIIEIARFETSVRRYLEATVPRLMLVLNPVQVIIDNLPEDYLEMLEVPFSKDPAYGDHSVPFTRTIYIERDDFREADVSDYFRLAPGKTVGLLRVPFPITATNIDKDPLSGSVIAVHATYEKPVEGSVPKKPKAWIHWVADCPAQNSPIRVKVHVTNQLFNSSNPSAHPEGFLADINPKSEELFPNAMIEIGFEEISSRAPWPAEAGEKAVNENALTADHTEEPVEAHLNHASPRPETIRFQGIRMGYFCVDSYSKDGSIVLNRTVTLKEDAGKT